MVSKKSLCTAPAALSDHRPLCWFICACSWNTRIGRTRSRSSNTWKVNTQIKTIASQIWRQFKRFYKITRNSSKTLLSGKSAFKRISIKPRNSKKHRMRLKGWDLRDLQSKKLRSSDCNVCNSKKPRGSDYLDCRSRRQRDCDSKKKLRSSD